MSAKMLMKGLILRIIPLIDHYLKERIKGNRINEG